MTRRIALVLLLLAGCDQVFGLERGPAACESLTMHDEDADTIVDTCDNCPGMPNPLQEDDLEIENGQLADGVGDACDPHVNDAGDYVHELYTFSGTDPMRDWRQIDGHWFMAEDQFRYDAATYDGWGSAFNLDPPLVPPYTIEGHLIITGIPEDEDQDAGMGILANSVPGGASSSCSLDRPGAGVYQLTAYHPNGQTAVDLPPITATSSYRMRMTYSPPVDIVCSATTDNQTFGTKRDFEPTEPHPIGSLAFESNRFVGGWDYVIVYAVKPPPPPP